MTTTYFGVWISGIGWMRANALCVAFESREVADETARRIGSAAKVYYIDKSLEGLESVFLEMEKKKKSRIMKLINLLTRKK